MDTIGILIATGALLVAIVVALVARASAGRVCRVDNYVISLDEREGFQVVHIKFQEEGRQVYTFEFDPTYGHVLSDELLTACAMAMRKQHQISRDRELSTDVLAS